MAVTDPRESEAAGLWLAEGLPIGDGSEPGLGRAVRAVDGMPADVWHGHLPVAVVKVLGVRKNLYAE